MIERRNFLAGLGVVAVGSMAPGFGRAGLARPPEPFVSNRNYFFYGAGQPIHGLHVTIDVDEDIVAPDAMSLQLNCSSPADADCVYQQYCIGMNPSWGDDLGFNWTLENFPSKAFRWKLHQSIGLPCSSGSTEADCHGNLYNLHPPNKTFATYPGVKNDRIPAGFKLRFDLIDGPGGAVIGANYTIVDAQGRSTTNGPRAHDFDYVRTSTKVGPDGVAPILALQLGIVGFANGAHTQLKSGAGRITYESTTPLTPLDGLADHPDVFQGGGTVEQANIRYSKLDAGPARKFVQQFYLAGSQHDDDQTTTYSGPTEGAVCPRGQTYNSLSQSCGVGNGRIITNDRAPPPRQSLQQPR
ncbi:MAG TPA: hypothetical protein VN814_16360 [Caulobacteraceae bacterium]|nr:hypothetical protein [Caulobacteraceae bacterium]